MGGADYDAARARRCIDNADHISTTREYVVERKEEERRREGWAGAVSSETIISKVKQGEVRQAATAGPLINSHAIIASPQFAEPSTARNGTNGAPSISSPVGARVVPGVWRKGGRREEEARPRDPWDRMEVMGWD